MWIAPGYGADQAEGSGSDQAVPKGTERVLRAGSELPFPSAPLQKGGRGQDGAKGTAYAW